MSQDTERVASNLVCFLLGAAVGAGVALLYAPKEGKETRRVLGEKAHEARDKAAEVTETVTHNARERWQTVAEKVQEFRTRQGATLENEPDAPSADTPAPEASA